MTAEYCLGCGAEDPKYDTEAHVHFDSGAFFWAPICGPACMDDARARAGHIQQVIFEALEDSGEGHSCSCPDADGNECELGDCAGAYAAVASLMEEHTQEAAKELHDGRDDDG